MKLCSDLVFRKEFDGTGILFNANDGSSFLLNATAAVICGCLEKGCTETEIRQAMDKSLKEIPANADQELQAFLQSLRDKDYLVE